MANFLMIGVNKSYRIINITKHPQPRSFKETLKDASRNRLQVIQTYCNEHIQNSPYLKSANEKFITNEESRTQLHLYYVFDHAFMFCPIPKVRLCFLN